VISTERSAASRWETLVANAFNAAVAAQRDHQAAAVALHAQRLDQRGARLQPQFVQPRRLRPPRAVQRHRLALAVQLAQRAAVDGHDSQAHRLLAAGGGHAQLAALLDHHQQCACVDQRQATVGHQPQQPQL
jgi:hypothetical protein